MAQVLEAYLAPAEKGSESPLGLGSCHSRPPTDQPGSSSKERAGRVWGRCCVVWSRFPTCTGESQPVALGRWGPGLAGQCAWSRPCHCGSRLKCWSPGHYSGICFPHPPHPWERMTPEVSPLGVGGVAHQGGVPPGLDPPQEGPMVGRRLCVRALRAVSRPRW